ncbi:LppA-related lipoprotein [Mesomycoplasma lagogenitalium]|uniref:Lipoprotein n=1 Tax=Mesomycoplasma lagogenitalium TaxID=171286 RepID=A0ABY8LT47_9BACT|nr:hypothetical protein [Mesomycoplasma lagogenitalium]WGI36413.1 hypothetical protein QEG99_03005 [Mesomycoplasma lagogenitalium]
MKKHWFKYLSIINLSTAATILFSSCSSEVENVNVPDEDKNKDGIKDDNKDQKSNVDNKNKISKNDDNKNTLILKDENDNNKDQKTSNNQTDKFQNVNKDQTDNNQVDKSKKNEQIKTTDKRENFLIPKDLEQWVLNLFPSLVGSMLVYNENLDKLNSLQYKKEGLNNINYSFLSSYNNATEIFREEKYNLNLALKQLFFETNNSDDQYEFDYKVKAVKADDLNGTLDIEVQIENLKDNSGITNIFTKTYSFSNFRKINKENFKNFFNFNLHRPDFKEILKKLKLVDIIKQNAANNQNEREINSLFNNKIDFFKKLMHSKLSVILNDNEKNAYHLKMADNKIENFKARNDNIAIYPFVTNLSDNIIKNINFYFVNTSDRGLSLKITVDYELFLLKSTSMSDMVDIGFTDQVISWQESYILPIDSLDNE